MISTVIKGGSVIVEQTMWTIFNCPRVVWLFRMVTE